MPNSPTQMFRLKLWRKYNKVCYWCKSPTKITNKSSVTPGILDDDAATVDHLTPVCLNKNNDCVNACYRCNNNHSLLQSATCSIIIRKGKIELSKLRWGEYFIGGPKFEYLCQLVNGYGEGLVFPDIYGARREFEPESLVSPVTIQPMPEHKRPARMQTGVTFPIMQ